MNEIRRRIAELNPDVIFYNGYDNCILGVVRRYGMETVVCYDYDAIIRQMVKEGLTEDEAVEHFEFNIIGGWNGEQTPCFVSLMLPQRKGCVSAFDVQELKPKRKKAK